MHGAMCVLTSADTINTDKIVITVLLIKDYCNNYYELLLL